MKLSDHIAAKIASEHQMEAATAMHIVDRVMHELAEAIVGGSTIDFPGAGTLYAEQVPERRDHHPSTGEAIATSASVRVAFRLAL
ncbi:hypothetical protein VW35_19235 [Devosia soli]|uniref:DNA-binding protein n=1 Tax=Devosia soli TaxID=361041 RepID=A0A0F5L103_9HYPH|nr:HU family DNA-binding protein [Devosia soli]KKB75890.1 hypothetical protein VW35_19235 [Devosia soli]